jgi:hypothetical protein
MDGIGNVLREAIPFMLIFGDSAMALLSDIPMTKHDL